MGNAERRAPHSRHAARHDTRHAARSTAASRDAKSATRTQHRSHAMIDDAHFARVCMQILLTPLLRVQIA
jgi:hypothetical protein